LVAVVMDEAALGNCEDITGADGDVAVSVPRLDVEHPAVNTGVAAIAAIKATAIRGRRFIKGPQAAGGG
jgi:hypothetical protein